MLQGYNKITKLRIQCIIFIDYLFYYLDYCKSLINKRESKVFSAGNCIIVVTRNSRFIAILGNFIIVP
jgi:hypothetical protein